MKILILGAGQVGSTLCKNLARDSENDITVIDKNATQLQTLNRYLDIKTVHGFVTNTTTLESANISEMDMVIAVATSDEKNMIACQMAHILYGVKTKIARLRSAEYIKHPKLFSPTAIPIDFVITAEGLITQFIRRMIEVPGATQVREFENGLVNLVETRAFAGTPIVDKPIRDLHEHLPKNQVRIVHLLRNNKTIAVSGDTIVRGGDTVYFLSKKDLITKALSEFRRRDKPYKRIMIAGGGQIGLNLAMELESNYRIHIIELDKNRVKEIANHLQNAIVLHGSASDEILLEEAGIEQTDLFLALTDSDETNVIISILAKQLGAHKTVALVKREVYENLALQSPDIDMVISPDQITVGNILSYIRRADTMRVYSLRQGTSEALEVIVHSHNTQVVNHPIWKIPLPDGTTIGCVVRDQEVIMGSKKVVIKDGDHVLLLLTKMDKIHEVEALFQPKE